MNDSAPSPENDRDSDSLDCIDLNIDGPVDMTVRPMRPHLVRFLREQEERRARLMELWKQQQEPEKAKEAPGAGNGQPS
jgi:hypothetical protein